MQLFLERVYLRFSNLCSVATLKSDLPISISYSSGISRCRDRYIQTRASTRGSHRAAGPRAIAGGKANKSMSCFMLLVVKQCSICTIESLLNKNTVSTSSNPPV